MHVAAAANYGEMVEFLLTKGADIRLQTLGEEQQPIHFAAKNDAVSSLQLLISFGADTTCKDYKGRTPLQVRRRVKIYNNHINTMFAIRLSL